MNYPINGPLSDARVQWAWVYNQLRAAGYDDEGALALLITLKPDAVSYVERIKEGKD